MSDYEVYLSLRVACVAHPEHPFLAERRRRSKQFLRYDMFGDVAVPQFVAVSREEQFLLHSCHIIHQPRVKPQ